MNVADLAPFAISPHVASRIQDKVIAFLVSTWLDELLKTLLPECA